MHKKSGLRKGQDLDRGWQHRNSPLSPSYLSPHQLQQKIGNRAITNLLQAKLAVGQPNDCYEQEADRTAAAIMRMPASLDKDLEEDKASLQTTPQLQAQSTTPIPVPDGFETQLAQHQTGGNPLPTSTRDFMEPRFGADFSHVRIHKTPTLADAIHAKAFTHRNHIYFNAGQYNPGTHSGKLLLAHELTHVLQQTGHVQRQRRIFLDQDDQQLVARKKLEDFVRSLPMSTPEDKDVSFMLIQSLVQFKGDFIDAAAGGNTLLPAVGAPFNATQVVYQLTEGNYSDAANSMVALVGDAATALSALSAAAMNAGAINSLSTLAQLGQVAGMLAGAFPLITIAKNTLTGFLSIISDTNENFGQAYFIVDASGILTSWLFNDKSISPHAKLLPEVKEFGLYGADLSEYLISAHQSVDQFWKQNLSGNPELVKQIRAIFGNDYREVWLFLGTSMQNQLQPRPAGIAVAKIKEFIR